MKAVSLVILLILAVICSLIFYRNFRIQRSLVDLANTQEIRLKEALVNEQKLIDQGLQEKYKADIDSFEALAKKMAAEKLRAKELEDKIKAQDKGKK